MRYDFTAGFPVELRREMTARIFRLIETEGNIPRWSKLGLFRQAELVIVIARQNISQMVAGDLFGISQSTVSRMWRRLLPMIDAVLPDCEQGLHDAEIDEATVLVDGTFIPTGNRPASGLGRLNYSGYRLQQCLSIQVAVNLEGTLLAVSKLVPGSRHDSKAIDLTG